MLNFRNINILFVIVLLACLAGYHFLSLSVYTLPILIAGYLSIVFYGCYHIGSNFFINVVCFGKTKEKIIAITFDDGPDTVNTPQILQVLREHGTEAAFFCIGRKIKSNHLLVKQAYDDGHLIGNHSYSHSFWFDMFSSKKMLAEMKMMNAETLKIIGKTPYLFRPPYGVTNPNLRKAIIAGNFEPVGWSVRTMDTVIKTGEKLLNKSLNELKPGAVYLFHDTSNTTVTILPEFLKQIELRGYRIIRLDKMLNLQPYA